MRSLARRHGACAEWGSGPKQEGVGQHLAVGVVALGAQPAPEAPPLPFRFPLSPSFRVSLCPPISVVSPSLAASLYDSLPGSPSVRFPLALSAVPMNTQGLWSDVASVRKGTQRPHGEFACLCLRVLCITWRMG